MILVDSSVWIDYFNGVDKPATDRLDDLLGSELLLTGDIIILKVLQGFRRDVDYRRAKAALETLAFREMLGHEIALGSAANYRRLRARGITVRKTIDMIVATFCLVNGYHLLHADRDFMPMEQHLGLRSVAID